LLTLANWLPTSTAKIPSILSEDQVKRILPDDADTTATVPPGDFANWFEPVPPASKGVVTLNGLVKPANSLEFSDDSHLKNVDFYQWAEQMFLWITSPVQKSNRDMGIVLNSPEFYRVSPDDHGKRTFIANEDPPTNNAVPLDLRNSKRGPNRLPIIVDKRGRLFEVAKTQQSPNNKPLVSDNQGKSVEVDRITLGNPGDSPPIPVFWNGVNQILKPKAILPDALGDVQQFTTTDGKVPVFLNASGDVIEVEVGQGGTDNVLLTQKSRPVFYMISVNDVYAYFLTGTKNGRITPRPRKFPTTPGDLEKITSFAKPKEFPHPNALCVEVKTSWVEADYLDDPGAYITMMARIPTYTKNVPNSQHWAPNSAEGPPVKLALVGIHIAGSANRHAEMIWTTFEHFGNTPNAPYQYKASGAKTFPQDKTGTWLFCQTGATPATSNFNTPRQYASGADIFLIPNTSNTTIGPSNTIRFMPFGASWDQTPNDLIDSSADSNTQIISMNKSVREQLVPGDVRRNYFMLGATWTRDGLAPDQSYPGNILGTSQLANSTMESFFHTKNTYGPDKSCFSCHKSKKARIFATTGVSHIFDEIQELFR
jgi:hypothetical protein